MSRTYVGLRVLNPANTLLYEHCKSMGVPVQQSMFDNRLHVTVIYSRKHCPKMIVNSETKYVAQFDKYDIFSGSNGENVLVARLKTQAVELLHRNLMRQHEATYDFPEYHPHITLSYKYTDNSVLGLTPINFPIILGEAYVEDLDEDWK